MQRCRCCRYYAMLAADYAMRYATRTLRYITLSDAFECTGNSVRMSNITRLFAADSYTLILPRLRC